MALAGKGGSGKTTISATLARTLARQGFEVVAIDGDPNPNLGAALGIGLAAREGLKPLTRSLITEEEAEGGRVRLRLSQPLVDVAREFGVRGPDGVNLMLTTQIQHAGGGCVCSAHAVVRDIIHACNTGAREVILLDMEASLEHMGRGTMRDVETLFIVTEPYFRSLESAGRLHALAAELEIPQVLAVVNKVRTADEEQAVRDYCGKRGLEIAAVIPFDPEVTRADNGGRALMDVAPDSEAVRMIGNLALVLDRLKEVA
ncbi:MAG: carbon monoxide dehydrogenase accessory protein CooC [Candidatus Dormibacteria bacterium]